MQALIVDADSRHAVALKQALEAHQFSVQVFALPSEVIRQSSEQHPDLAFVSLDCQDEDGLSLLEEDLFEDTFEVILMNDRDDIHRVNEGIRKGASYFFTKPFDTAFIDNLVKDVAAELTVTTSKTNTGVDQHQIDQFALLRGSSRRMRRLYRTMRKVAKQNSSVFIVGESGVGKDLVAQSLHMLGARADQPFIAVNCAAVPEELFESELFGHEKGSFSGAVARHEGFFERAAGGTLFLDEITEMPVELQAKLLRALDGSSFRRVGGNEELESDVRVLASTNRDPETAIRDQVLREDLYFRLASLVLAVPPLRDRDDDVLALAEYFLHELNEEHGANKSFSNEASDAITSYAWPGNVRELKGAVERAHVLSDGKINATALGTLDYQVNTSIDDPNAITIQSDSTIAEAEEQLIFAALEAHRGNKKQAAESLGISLKTLYNRLKEFDQPDT